MLRLLLPVVKLLLALTVFYFSYAMRFPVILYLGFGWCGWLGFVVRGWRWRLLATLGFAMVASGWWAYLRGNYFLGQMGGRHIGSQADPLSRMANICFWESLGLTVAGIIVLAFVDYMRPFKPKIASELANEVDVGQGEVWPPAPKQQN